MKLHTAKATYCTVEGRAVWWYKIWKDLDPILAVPLTSCVILEKWTKLPEPEPILNLFSFTYKLGIISLLQAQGLGRLGHFSKVT